MTQNFVKKLLIYCKFSWMPTTPGLFSTLLSYIKLVKVDFVFCYRYIRQRNTWDRFHQCFNFSFFSRRSQKCKKTLMTWLFFYFWNLRVHIFVGEIDPWSQIKKLNIKRQKELNVECTCQRFWELKINIGKQTGNNI